MIRRWRAKWLPRNWADVFEMLLTTASIYSGLIYTLGPERLRAIYTFVNQFTPGSEGMQILGALWLIGGLLILGSRFLLPRPTNLRRVGHAISAGVYFLMAFGLASSIVAQGPASSGAAFWPYLIACVMHIYYGTEEPSLRRRDKDGSRKG